MGVDKYPVVPPALFLAGPPYLRNFPESAEFKAALNKPAKIIAG